MIKKRIQRSNPLLPSANFFFQANVLAAKEIIPGVNLFLLSLLQVDKLRRLLFDRNASQVHSFLKSIHDPKLMVGQFALTDIFLVVSVFPLFSFVLTKTPSSRSHEKTLYDIIIKRAMHDEIFVRWLELLLGFRLKKEFHLRFVKILIIS